MKYYILSLKHTRGDFLSWWRPEERGYCWSLDAAGVYDEEHAKRIEAQGGYNGVRSAVAIPVDVAIDVSYRVIENFDGSFSRLGVSMDEWRKASRA